MDPGWRFLLGDPAGAERPSFDDRGWRALDLPHDWSIEGTPRKDAPGGGGMGYFPAGTGWYRKAFRLPAGARGRETWLEFDGVYMNSDVWLNGVRLGHRPFGYISFAYDITRHLVPGVNVVAVRVDNSRQPGSRWYSGSGIYRHVWLTVTDRLHVRHWGTYVTTPHADSAMADLLVRTRVDNGSGRSRHGVLRSVVMDSAGREVVRAEAPFSLAAGGEVEIEQVLQVKSPQLWSVEAPALYALHSTIREGESAVDTVLTAFGIRSIAYDKDRGFLLNGRQVKMRGVNLHHEAGGLGAAVPEQVWRRRLETLKAMGANAIRTAHNPPAPEFLDSVRQPRFSRDGGGVRRVDLRQGAGRLPQVLRRVVRAGRHRLHPAGPKPSLHCPVERRQRDRRAGDAGRRPGAPPPDGDLPPGRSDPSSHHRERQDCR